ncbi:MAG: hypothetical protein A2033_05170 [Bacteroidetes bacterium GWA2_31_9]|nr:MAG: hypothetical protein A2033_05170 [Bacteroidetes bacterium GWA2_31_9]
MFDLLNSTNNLSAFLQTNGDSLFEISNVNYEQLKEEKTKLETFILFHRDKIETLDFSINRNRAFLLLLFDLCERLRLSGCLEQIYILLKKYEIKIGCRLQAATLFNFGIPDNELYISRFDEICQLLGTAQQEEEDDYKKVVATFANYYLTVLDRHEIWINRLREKVLNSIDLFPFLSQEFISQLLSFDVKYITQCFFEIQNLKDNLFGRFFIETSISKEQFLIEENNNYVTQINSIQNISFDIIRRIAKDNVEYNSKLDNRGVTPLITVDDMFTYLKNYGNMHYAKMYSALDMLPSQDIKSDIEIVDWGCGQALASLTFIEYCKNKKISIERLSITLIEPSELAIKRAALHTKLFFSKSNIKTICKYIDDVKIDDVKTKPDSIKIHLFSNILDVELFSISNLENLIINSQFGKNYFICVSPYIDDLKTERVDSFNRYFKINYTSNYTSFGEETNNKCDDKFWNCNNKFNGNFNGRYCKQPHPKYGCSEQWTRVIRVFKIEL